MRMIMKTYREWWQVPRRAGDRPEHRQVTFLELFYDLVYVALIAQLAHALSTHITLDGLGEYVFLFITVWWTWFNGSVYHALHGNNDMRTRVFTFVQMLVMLPGLRSILSRISIPPWSRDSDYSPSSSWEK